MKNRRGLRGSKLKWFCKLAITIREADGLYCFGFMNDDIEYYRDECKVCKANAVNVQDCAELLKESEGE